MGGQQQKQGPVDHQTLFQQDTKQLIGRKVQLDQPVQVSRVVSDRVLYIRDPAGQGSEILVHTAKPMKGLQTGDQIMSIEGNVRQTKQSDLKKWGLDKQDMQQAMEQQAFIEAKSLEQGQQPQQQSQLEQQQQQQEPQMQQEPTM